MMCSMLMQHLMPHSNAAICCMLRILTEEEPRNGTLELEQVPDDGSTSAWGGGGGIHSSDVGEAFAGLGVNGVPHQARRSK